MSKYVPWRGGGGGEEFQLVGSGSFRGSRNKGTETVLLENREMGRAPCYACFTLFLLPPGPPQLSGPQAMGCASLLGDPPAEAQPGCVRRLGPGPGPAPAPTHGLCPGQV